MLNPWPRTFGRVRWIMAFDGLSYAPRAFGPPVIATRLPSRTRNTRSRPSGTTSSSRPTVVSMSLQRGLYNTTLLVQTRRHEVISGRRVTHAYRTVYCTARTAERIAHLLRIFRISPQQIMGIVKWNAYIKIRHICQHLSAQISPFRIEVFLSPCTAPLNARAVLENLTAVNLL